MVDKALARELVLFGENDANIYRRYTVPYAKNLAKKKLRGTFSKTMALKGIINQFNWFKQQYVRSYGSLGSSRVDMDTKKAFANEFYSGMVELIQDELKELKRLEKMKLKKKKVGKVNKKRK